MIKNLLDLLPVQGKAKLATLSMNSVTSSTALSQVKVSNSVILSVYELILNVPSLSKHDACCLLYILIIVLVVPSSYLVTS